MVRPGPVWIDASSRPAVAPDGDGTDDAAAGIVAASPPPYLGAGPLGDPTLLGAESSDAALDVPRFRSLTGRPDGYSRPTGAAAVVTPGGHRPGGPVLLPGQTSPLEALSDLLGQQQRGPGARRPDGSTVLGSPGAALAAQFGIMSPSGGGGAGAVASAVALIQSKEAALDAWRVASGTANEAEAKEIVDAAQLAMDQAMIGLSFADQARVERSLARADRAAARRKGARARQARRQAAYTAAHDAAHGGAEATRHAARMAAVEADRSRRAARAWLRFEAEAARQEGAALASEGAAVRKQTPQQFREWRATRSAALAAEARASLAAARSALASAARVENSVLTMQGALDYVELGVQRLNRAIAAGESVAASPIFATVRRLGSAAAAAAMAFARGVADAMRICRLALKVAGSAGNRRLFVAAREAIEKAERAASRVTKSAKALHVASRTGNSASIAAATRALRRDTAAMDEAIRQATKQLDAAIESAKPSSRKAGDGKPAPKASPPPPWPGTPPADCQGDAGCPTNEQGDGCRPDEVCEECHWEPGPQSIGGGKAKAPGDAAVPPSGGAGKTVAAQADTPPLPVPPPVEPPPKRPPDTSPPPAGAAARDGAAGPDSPTPRSVGGEAVQPGSGVGNDERKEPAPKPADPDRLRRGLRMQAVVEFIQQTLHELDPHLDVADFPPLLLSQLVDDPEFSEFLDLRVVQMAERAAALLHSRDASLSDADRASWASFVVGKQMKILALDLDGVGRFAAWADFGSRGGWLDGPDIYRVRGHRAFAQKWQSARERIDDFEVARTGELLVKANEIGWLKTLAILPRFGAVATKMYAKSSWMLRLLSGGVLALALRESKPELDLALSDFAALRIDDYKSRVLREMHQEYVSSTESDLVFWLRKSVEAVPLAANIVLTGGAIGGAIRGIAGLAKLTAAMFVVQSAGNVALAVLSDEPGSLLDKAARGIGAAAVEAGLFFLVAASAELAMIGLARGAAKGAAFVLAQGENILAGARQIAESAARTGGAAGRRFAEGVGEALRNRRAVYASMGGVGDMGEALGEGAKRVLRGAESGATSDVVPVPPTVGPPAPPPPPPPPVAGRPVTPGGSTSAATPHGGGGGEPPAPRPKPAKLPPEPTVEPGKTAAEVDGADKIGRKRSGGASGSGSAGQALRTLPERRAHILDQHGPGRGVPGEREFPSWLSDDQVIDHVERIANDPASFRNGLPTGDGSYRGFGTITGPNGETVRVMIWVEPQGRGPQRQGSCRIPAQRGLSGGRA